MKALPHPDRYITIREIAEQLNLFKTIISDRIRRRGLVTKLHFWIPYNLKEIHVIRRINICDVRLKGRENDSFLQRIATSDGKCMLYKSEQRNRSWSKHGRLYQITKKPCP